MFRSFFLAKSGPLFSGWEFVSDVVVLFVADLMHCYYLHLVFLFVIALSWP